MKQTHKTGVVPDACGAPCRRCTALGFCDDQVPGPGGDLWLPLLATSRAPAPSSAMPSSWVPASLPTPPTDLDETGPGGRAEDDWTLADGSESCFSFVASEAADWDVRSVASMDSTGALSAGGCSVSSTAPAPFAIDNGTGTASTTGLPIPLAAVPASLLYGPRDLGSDVDDTRSLVSVNTRRGWPRVSPTARPPQAEPNRPASYRDILLVNRQSTERQQQEQQEQQHDGASHQTSANPSQRYGCGVLTPSRRGHRLGPPVSARSTSALHANVIGGRVVLLRGRPRGSRPGLATLDEEGLGDSGFDD